MYLKVPDRSENGQKHDTTCEEIEAFLAGENVTVSMVPGINFPCVEFPEGTPSTEYQRIQNKLEAGGFTAY